MKNILFKRVLTAFLIAVMAVASVTPAAAAKNGIRNAEVSANGSKKLDVTSGLAKKLLNGNDTKEYVLGTASHFVIFTKEFSIEGNADCEGRIAADEFLIPTGYRDGYPVKGNLTSASSAHQTANDGSAAVICNNSKSGEFGYVQPHYAGVNHPYVVSDSVQRFVGPVASEVRSQTYAVKANTLINFDAEFEKLAEVSAKLATQSNGTVKFNQNDRTLTLTGKDGKVNYFAVSASDFANAGTVKINVPSGSYVVVNVPGKTVNYTAAWSDCVWFNGKFFAQESQDNSYVLYNFYEATKVNLKKSNRGAILAPKAYVEDQVPVNQGHISAQIVAAKVHLKNQIGFRGFLMPYPEELFKIPEDDKYTVHYLYYDAEGNLKEFPGGSDGFYSLFIGKNSAPTKAQDAFEAGESICAVDSASVKKSVLSRMKNGTEELKLYAELLENQCGMRFEVYEDGKNVSGALTGSALLKKSAYQKMNRKSDINWDDSYTFGTSNVYFIMYPVAKVSVDVKWDDKQDKSGKRPDTFSVKLTEDVSGETKVRDTAELLSKKKSVSEEYDDELDRMISYDVYEDCYTCYVPLFGTQNGTNGKAYGSTIDKFDGNDAIFDISYTVPNGYLDVTDVKAEKPATAGVKDKNGNVIVDENGVVANYHIVLRGEYTATFYIVDQKGTRTEVTKEDFTDPFRGYSVTETLPTLTTSEVKKVLGSTAALEEYTITWKDISKQGKSYTAGDDNYEFDYEDVVFETTLRRNEIVTDGSPWLFEYILLFRDSHYIPAPSVYDRLKADKNADEYTFVQRKINGYTTDYAWNKELKTGKYKDERFFLFSFAYGIDTDRAVSTRVTVSTEGLGRNVTDFIYDSGNTTHIVDQFCEMPGRANAVYRNIKQLLPHDPFVNDYDGMNYFRLALPCDEYEDETLYFTVYYTDAFGRESVWFYYSVNLKQNNHWTLKGK